MLRCRQLEGLSDMEEVKSEHVRLLASGRMRRCCAAPATGAEAEQNVVVAAWITPGMFAKKTDITDLMDELKDSGSEYDVLALQ